MGALGPLLEFYRENGPCAAARHHVPLQSNPFGFDGYLVMLVGNRAPYEVHHQATAAEWATWNQIRTGLRAQAGQGMTVAEALGVIRSPQWKWGS